jgi:putative colanic acid biosynthesis UDP-glucose lipid carrier transferase
MSVTRLLGVIFALVGLTLLAPLIAIVAIGTRLSYPGHILIRATRQRSDGTHFSFVRFRTNGPGSDQPTAFGRYVRTGCLDQLPALVSLLIGDITLQDLWQIDREPSV